jgi:hypothetical protein
LDRGNAFKFPQESNTTLAALKREHARPLIKTGGFRKLAMLAVNVLASEMAPFKDAWSLMRPTDNVDGV